MKDLPMAKDIGSHGRIKIQKVSDEITVNKKFDSLLRQKNNFNDHIGKEEDWLGARNFCRQRCMDAVSVETSPENEWIKQRIVDGKVSKIKFFFKGVSIPKFNDSTRIQ